MRCSRSTSPRCRPSSITLPHESGFSNGLWCGRRAMIARVPELRCNGHKGSCQPIMQRLLLVACLRVRPVPLGTNPCGCVAGARDARASQRRRCETSPRGNGSLPRHKTVYANRDNRFHSWCFSVRSAEAPVALALFVNCLRGERGVLAVIVGSPTTFVGASQTISG